MPELPEVETIKRTMAKYRETKIVGIDVLRSDVIRLEDFPIKTLHDKTIKEVYRRGKFLVFCLGDKLNLVVHLGMSGRFYAVNEDAVVQEPHIHIIIHLNNNQKLIYQDTRRFGGIWLVKDILAFFAHLGVEPLEENFNCSYLTGILKNRKIAIKTLLLNQNIVCGIGNIYADEALFMAGIRPDRSAGSLSKDEIEGLCQAIKKVLKNGIEHRGTTFRDYRDAFNKSGDFQNHLQVYGRSNEDCFQCGNKIKRQIIGGRSSHYCGICQK